MSWAATFGAALFSALGASDAALGRPLESGACIPVGTPDGRGPLATDAIISDAVGAAYVFGSPYPDLFVRTGKFGMHTGLFLYPWTDTADNGAPVFGQPHAVGHPFGGLYPPPGIIHQTADGAVHAVWAVGAALVHTRYDAGEKVFVEVGRVVIEGLPRNPRSVALIENLDGTVEALLEVSDGVAYKPSDFGGRDPRYRPYDGAGIWRGGHPYVCLWAATLPKFFEGPATNPRRVSTTEREVRLTYSHLAHVELGSGGRRDVVAGSCFGGLHYYRNNAPNGVDLAPKRHAVDRDGIAHRHPIIDPGPVAFPNAEGRFSDLIAGGEGCLYWYRFTGAFTDDGKPVYDDPTPVLQENAAVFGGSLPVANVVDWNGDGVMDIVAGNSEGRILFFRNAGTNETPAFLPGVAIEAGGSPIHVQPGYRLDIQGPGEARWGYTCPTVVDWDGDGLLDIVMSDSTARHTVFINRGTAAVPRLNAGHPLYFDGLDLHGTWRVKPAVAKIEGRMAYVCLDEQDEFHLYWRVDDYNLEDGGKLKLEDGSSIGAKFLSAGGTGRLKLNLVDWDNDGAIDLLVGTPRHASVPNPDTGLPQSLGLPGSAILVLRNTGTNAAPAFAFPELLAFRGQPIFLGQHACGPTIADFGHSDGPGIITGEEGGRFEFYARKDLSLISREEAKAALESVASAPAK